MLLLLTLLLYKQLIRPMMDYACPAWRSAARTHVRRLQVLKSKGFRLATGAPWYVSNSQIHEDLGVPLFADHMRALTASFNSKLAAVGNPMLRQLGRHLRWPRVDPVAWLESEGRHVPAGHSRPSTAITKSTKRIPFGVDQPRVFRIPWLRFSVIFLRRIAIARPYDAKLGTAPPARKLYLSAWNKFAFTTAILGSESRQPTKQSLSLPQLLQWPLGASFGKISQGPQSDFKIVTVSIFPC